MHEDKTILSLFRVDSHIDFCTKCVIMKFTLSLMTFEIQQSSCIVIYVLYLSNHRWKKIIYQLRK